MVYCNTVTLHSSELVLIFELIILNYYELTCELIFVLAAMAFCNNVDIA